LRSSFPSRIYFLPLKSKGTHPPADPKSTCSFIKLKIPLDEETKPNGPPGIAKRPLTTPPLVRSEDRLPWFYSSRPPPFSSSFSPEHKLNSPLACSFLFSNFLKFFRQTRDCPPRPAPLLPRSSSSQRNFFFSL